MSQFLAELKRRRVLRLAGLYIVGGWVLIQVLDVLFEAWGIPGTALRYVVMAAVMGFPLAVVFAWKFDITSSGIVRTLPGGGQDADSRLGRNDYIILFALMVIGAYVVWNASQQVIGTPVEETLVEVSDIEISPDSVAVLPFVDMSSDLADQYFGDGLAEELLNSLARLKDLKITARTSSFEFRGRESDIREIAQQLKVAKIIEGSVRKSGNRIRVTAQLINARDGYHIWSKTYDRELADVFAIQTEIAESMAAELYPELSSKDKSRLLNGSTRVPAAFDAYLRGKSNMYTRQLEKLEEAEILFREAIRLDPDYALALVALAETLVLMAFSKSEPEKDAAEKAQPFVLRALEISPALPSAHHALGSILSSLGQTVKADEEFKRAIELNPNSSRSLMLYGNSIRNSKPEESIVYFRRVVELDPMNPLAHLKLGTNSWLLKDYDAAIANYQKALDLDPEFAYTYNSMGFMYTNMQQLDRAAWAFRKAIIVDPASVFNVELLMGTLIDFPDFEGVSKWMAHVNGLTSGKSPRVAAMNRQLVFRRDGPEAARALDEAILEEFPEDLWALSRLSFLDIKDGVPEKALQRYESNLPHLFPASEVTILRNNIGPLSVITYVLQAMGEHDKASVLLPRLVDFSNEHADQIDDYQRARLYALQGNTEDAMVSLLKADEAGPDGIGLGVTWIVEADALLNILHKDSRYIEMMKRRHEELKRQLASWYEIRMEEGWE